MKKITAIFILAGICFFGSFNLAHSEVKAYLYLSGGINGESKNPNYPNWIELLTFSWQISNTGGFTAGAATFRAIPRPLVVKKLIDKASPLLFLKVFNGSHLFEARLALQQQGGNPYEVLSIKMSDVMIRSITGDTNSGLSAEAVALDFAKVCYKYTPLKADGSLDASIEKCWNVAKNVEE